ncbi:IS200/IS605 family transposase, partial [Rhodococcus sp. T7]|uniref:IS200/IS605 family transposase n=1 Tax=Rhodococcus sp. T7 TaxID=627444 RepID=UPI001F247869
TYCSGVGASFTTTIRFTPRAFPCGYPLVYVTEMMAEVCDKFGATSTAFTGETDHVHLSIHHPPTVQLSTLVNSLEGVSARYLRQEFPDHIQKYLWGNHFWSPSYFAASAGGAPLATVAEYITNQKRPKPTQESAPATRHPAVQNQLPPSPKGPDFL